jgi:hypothetical protein
MTKRLQRVSADARDDLERAIDWFEVERVGLGADCFGSYRAAFESLMQETAIEAFSLCDSFHGTGRTIRNSIGDAPATSPRPLGIAACEGTERVAFRERTRFRERATRASS